VKLEEGAAAAPWGPRAATPRRVPDHLMSRYKVSIAQQPAWLQREWRRRMGMVASPSGQCEMKGLGEWQERPRDLPTLSGQGARQLGRLKVHILAGARQLCRSEQPHLTGRELVQQARAVLCGEVLSVLAAARVLQYEVARGDRLHYQEISGCH